MLDNYLARGATAEMTMTRTRDLCTNEGERRLIKSKYIIQLQVVKILCRW